MKKAFLALSLVFALCLSMTAPAFATSDLDTVVKMADTLYAAKLFNGIGTDANGTPIYNLQGTATRAQAVTMLVRVLGKTAEAERGVWNTPFTDVPGWAEPYIGYAYENGLTDGISATTFGPNILISPNQYLTLLLTALGYNKTTDFQWNDPYKLAARIGLISPTEWENSDIFTRGDLVVTSYTALFTNCKGNTQTLAEVSGIAEQIAPINEGFSSRWSYILHAGGLTPDGIPRSNSIEALNHTYEQGYRIIEIDFCWTEDDHLVCIHDWPNYYAPSFGKDSITLEEYESVRHDKYGFTSITLDILAEWMTEHTDAVVVTDIKTGNLDGAKLIAEKYPDLIDRFCIQIYQTDEYDAVYELGFEKIILTLYQMSWEEKIDTNMLVSYAESHDLVGITFPVEMLQWVPGYVKALLKAKTPLFVHTVNGWEQQAELFEMGISGIYSDIGIGE